MNIANPVRRMRSPNGEPLRYLMEVVLAYDGDDCLAWPYAKSKDGYGAMQHEGKIHIVSRMVCMEAHGPPPTPEHEAAHSCGKGHEACVTKGHLSWKTPTENAADKRIHGTSVRGERCWKSKLVEAQALEIIALTGVVPKKDIAQRFSVSTQQIGRIQRGESWDFLQPARITRVTK